MFRFVDRKQNKHLVIAVGWAFDYRIFASLDLPYNYFFFTGPCIADFAKELAKLLTQNNIEKISLLGWSQGAFAVCDFISQDLAVIDEVILIGARKNYKGRLEKIKRYLKKNREAFLYTFYRECFCRQEEKNYLWFRDTLLNDYLKEMSLSMLLDDLEWLGKTEIQPQLLRNIDSLIFVHGKKDAVAPLSEAFDIAETLPNASFIAFEETGHLPFLRDDFKKRLYE